MLNVITRIDMLKEAQQCIDDISDLKGHIKLDLLEENESGADLSLLIISDLPFSWKLRDKIVDTVYDCLEKYDPYITLHFEWKTVGLED